MREMVRRGGERGGGYWLRLGLGFAFTFQGAVFSGIVVI